MDKDRDGRLMGPRARRRAAELQEAFVRLVERTPWHEVTVVAIAREAKASPGVFWLYYESLPDIAVRAVNGLRKRGGAVPPHLERVYALIEFEQSAGIIEAPF